MRRERHGWAWEGAGAGVGFLRGWGGVGAAWSPVSLCVGLGGWSGERVRVFIGSVYLWMSLQARMFWKTLLQRAHCNGRYTGLPSTVPRSLGRKWGTQPQWSHPPSHFDDGCSIEVLCGGGRRRR